MMTLLEYYESRAKDMSDAELFYALQDVMESIKIQESDEWTRNHLSECAYLQKLYAEKDAYSVALYTRGNK